MVSLEEYFRPSADIAVEKAMHKHDRVKYHERWPVGQCPLCSVSQNALARAAPEFRERVADIIKSLETEL